MKAIAIFIETHSVTLLWAAVALLMLLGFLDAMEFRRERRRFNASMAAVRESIDAIRNDPYRNTNRDNGVRGQMKWWHLS